MASKEVIHLSDRESLSPRNSDNNRNGYNSSAIRHKSHQRRQGNNTQSSHRTNHRSRRLHAMNTNDVIELDSSSSPENIRNARELKRNQPQHQSMLEVIDVDSDTSPIPPKQQNPPGKRRKFASVDSDDVEVIQVYSPPRTVATTARTSLKSACAATASLVSSRQYEKSPVDQIREVFPTLSRSKAQSYVWMAECYCDYQDVVPIVMTVLADDPSGESITEKVFAAAAVGGRIDTVDTPISGQKVAQLECNCCFVDYDFGEMVSCKSGHLFCKTCLQKHTETRVFGLGNFGIDASKEKRKVVEILCMHSNGCSSGFQEGHLRRALSEKVMKKYDELQYEAVVEGFKDTSKCTKCDFIAFAEETISTFHCPRCNFKSCRECGEEAHPGIRCDEVETKNETSGRNKVEEAMTNAVVRKCPRPMCRKPFMKTDGCNKITCSCGAFICYICRKEIPKKVAYKHFCQTPHCNHSSCNKCGLYADAEFADQIALKKAAKDAAKSVSTGRKGVTVDVDVLLKNPQPHQSVRGNHRVYQEQYRQQFYHNDGNGRYNNRNNGGYQRPRNRR